MALDKDFLWGGALAAHQFEGGVLNTSKGLSVADVMTAVRTVFRALSRTVWSKAIITRTTSASTSMAATKRISLCSQKWASSASAPRSLGRASFRMAMKQSRMKKACSSMMMFSMSY